MVRLNSIQTRLVVAVIALVTTIIVSFTFFSYQQIRASLIEQLEHEAFVIVSPFYASVANDLPDDVADIAIFSRVAIISKSSTFFPEALDTFTTVKDVIYISSDAEILYTSGMLELPDSIANGQEQTIVSNDGTVIIVVPFTIDGQNLGSSVLFFSSETLSQQQQALVRTAVAIFIPFMLIGTLGTLFIGRSIVHPIVELTNSISEEDSNLDIGLYRNDEVGILARNFRQMREAIDLQIIQLNNEIQERKRAEALLDAYNQDLESIVEKRTGDLKIASAVARQLTKVLDLQVLLPQLVEQTQEAFKLDYVCIYLYDEASHYLTLKAGTGNVGAKMVTAGHRFHIDTTPSLVAKAARLQKPIVISDVKQSKDFMSHPDLANTASETVLPMVVGQKIIGVMSLQSNLVGRFHEDDLEVFAILTEQIAIAVVNAELYATQIQLADDLRRADELKSSFLASMSHELRTPLNAIINFTEMISVGMLGDVNDDQKELLGKSLESSHHLLNLINDVLDVSKIQAGKLSLFIENDVNLNKEIETAVSIASPLIGDKAVQLVVQVEDKLPLFTGDKRRIRQIILNLLSNAIKFTDTGTVTLNAKCEEGNFALAVVDTGSGIPKDKQKAIFQPFVQTEGGVKQEQGTGLGLAITSSLVEAHHGQIWLESKEGKGSAFYVKMPIM